MLLNCFRLSADFVRPSPKSKLLNFRQIAFEIFQKFRYKFEESES
jgi:hypothetical protein